MVATPKWRFEYNLNTLVIPFGFAGGLIAWGATWERVNPNQDSQANSIDRLDKPTNARPRRRSPFGKSTITSFVTARLAPPAG